MFALLSPTTWKIGIGILLLAAIAYGIHHFLGYEQNIGYEKAVAEYTQKQLIAEQKARAKEQALNTQIVEAQNAANERQQQLDKVTSSLAITNKQLHDTTNTLRNRLSKNSPATNINTADTALSVFSDCTDRYSELAETADKYTNEIKMLQDAWPK
jgi:exonuclease VII large subunit